MKSLYELQGVYGLDRETLESLIPLVETGLFVDNKTKTLKEQLVDGKHQIFIRYNQILEKAAGYQTPETPTSSHYLGDRSRLYLRYRYQFGTLLSYGITIEKTQVNNYLIKKILPELIIFLVICFSETGGRLKPLHWVIIK